MSSEVNKAIPCTISEPTSSRHFSQTHPVFVSCINLRVTFSPSETLRAALHLFGRIARTTSNNAKCTQLTIPSLLARSTKQKQKVGERGDQTRAALYNSHPFRARDRPSKVYSSRCPVVAATAAGGVAAVAAIVIAPAVGAVGAAAAYRYGCKRSTAPLDGRKGGTFEVWIRRDWHRWVPTQLKSY
ncbi:hypothetical protein DFJ73DRAFT_813473 [Zopfochytrium polystomum]|nr:hypothetical protein DFJ73DRAFT_813473 [Zopfochytrium polystomum]